MSEEERLQLFRKTESKIFKQNYGILFGILKVKFVSKIILFATYIFVRKLQERLILSEEIIFFFSQNINRNSAKKITVDNLWLANFALRLYKTIS
jgi:hypothetical protein